MSGEEFKQQDACGCCEGVSIKAPAVLYNRPGLSAIAYRIGTHSEVLDSLQARLSSQDYPALEKLRTRDNDDFSIALLDAYACMADVLSFYQERIINESYLRTAGERLSMSELARLIGYRLKPGVAAETWLAFTMQEPPPQPPSSDPKQATGVPETIMLNIGIKVQSIPGPDEKPQTFETVESIEARSAWNVFLPKMHEKKLPSPGTTTIYLKGTATNLKLGDALLFRTTDDQTSTDANSFDFVHIQSAETDSKADHTKVVLERSLKGKSPSVVFQNVYAMRLRAAQFGHNAPDWKTLSDSIKTAYSGSPGGDAGIRVGQTDPHNTDWKNYNTSGVTLAVDTTAAGFKDAPMYSVSLYGTGNHWEAIGENAIYSPTAKGFQIYLHNTTFNGSQPYINAANAKNQNWYVKWVGIPTPNPGGTDWPPDVFKNRLAANGQIELDSAYPSLVFGTWLILVKPDNTTRLYNIKAVAQSSRADFSISSKTTLITLSGDTTDLVSFGLRETTVLAQSEPLNWAENPITEEEVEGDFLRIDRKVENLPLGRKLILNGTTSAAVAEEKSEVLTLLKTEPDGDTTKLYFTTSLLNTYKRESVKLYANVALATHGETVNETLGSGAARQSHQRFTLRHIPLTYVGADNETGAEAALEVRVNDIRWHETRTLYNAGANDRSYVLRVGEDGAGTIQFGDGRRGARLPTGQDNLRAIYRKGIGAAGNLQAGQLSQLLSRPLGLKAVSNPRPAEGGVDADSADHARRNMPLGVRTLGRVVSVLDYEDYARAYTGIAKAQATVLNTRAGRTVFISVAGDNGVQPPTLTIDKLLNALKQNGDPLVHCEIKAYNKATFHLALRIKCAPDYDSKKVLADVEAALRRVFSFDPRDFGQIVSRSEVITVAQEVEGVLGVDLDSFYRGTTITLEERLTPAAATVDTLGNVSSAELLLLDPGSLDSLKEMP